MSKELDAKIDSLNDREQIFVYEYIVDYNAARAARSAGYNAVSAKQIGYELINKPRIKAAIKLAIDERSERLQIDADKVLSMYWTIATADYNELVQLRRNNCRYCFGVDNEYQWTKAEYEEACEIASSREEAEPLCAGGVAFNINGDPNPKCPECQGNGIESVYIEDTTKLSAQANLVYQGIKHGKSGTEVMMADRIKALDTVARYLGMFKETINHTSDDGSMSPVTDNDLSNLTDDELRELAKLTSKIEQGSMMDK